MELPHGLCVGLDPDPGLIPPSFRGTGMIAAFLQEIVLATRHVAAAYKINTAFFEQLGADGIAMLFAVRELVGDSYCVLDGKRADIGNTSAAYARSLFGEFKADAVTVAPYMGHDSIAPFLDYGLTYVLALTSNPGSADFQRITVHTPSGTMPLYQHVMRTVCSWEGAGKVGFVVGATHPTELAEIRKQWPTVPLLLPGIGAQGATAKATALANGEGPALFNVGRAIMYAGKGADFAEAAGIEAERLAHELSR